MFPHVLVDVAIMRLIYLFLVNLVQLLMLLHKIVELLPLTLNVMLGAVVHLAFRLLFHNIEKIYHVDELLELFNFLLILLFLLNLLWIWHNICS